MMIISLWGRYEYFLNDDILLGVIELNFELQKFTVIGPCDEPLHGNWSLKLRVRYGRSFLTLPLLIPSLSSKIRQTLKNITLIWFPVLTPVVVNKLLEISIKKRIESLSI
jgi:hypothetical protein